MNAIYTLDNSWGTLSVVARDADDTWDKYFTVERAVERKYLGEGELTTVISDEVSIDIDYRVRHMGLEAVDNLIFVAQQAKIAARRLAEVEIDGGNIHRLTINKETGELWIVGEDTWADDLAAALAYADIFVNIEDEGERREFRARDEELHDWYNHVIASTPDAEYPVPTKKQIKELAAKLYREFMQAATPEVGDIVTKPKWDPRKECTVVEVGPKTVKLQYRVKEEYYHSGVRREEYEAEYGELYEDDWTDKYGYEEYAQIGVEYFETRQIGALLDSVELVSRPGVTVESFLEEAATIVINS